MDRLHLVDCTLREGDQAPGVAFTPAEKLVIAQQLDRAGVALADAGMPALGPQEQGFLRAAVDACEHMVVGASVRCLPEMVDLALGCGVGAVFVICPISRLHLEKRLGVTVDGLIANLGRCAERVAAAGASLELVAEDATRADPEDLAALVRAGVRHGAARVYVADTVGALTPAGYAARVAQVVSWADGELAVGLHCHNDFGMATANTVAGVEAGARWPTACVNGLGERAGNADLGAVALACSELLGLDTGFRPRALSALARAVELASGQLIPAQAPLVGQNAFRHESGIHVDGLLKDPRTYEVLDPALVGAQRSLVLGRHTGRAHLRALASEAGLTLDDQALDALRDQLQQQSHGVPREATQALRDALARHVASGTPLGVDQLLAWARLMGDPA